MNQLQSNKEYLSGFNQERRDYIDQLKNGSNNILVAIRTRPLNQRELDKSDFEVVRILDERVVVLIDPGYESNQNDVLRKNRNKEMQFAFDFAFDKDVQQAEVFEKTSNFLLDGVVEGFNATVFAYGATGAGKTFTMVGYGENLGIMNRTMNQLFYLMGQNSKNQYTVRVSYLEIYNENIKDLLSIEDRNLDLREDPSQGVVVAGITEIQCGSTQEIMALLKVGNRNRSKEATEANEVSSRSHAVLQVQVEIKEMQSGGEGDEEVRYAKLSMVDLAGSERAANTNNRGIRMIEGAKINQSLLCLGNCIQALSQMQEKNNKNAFVPYRGSKLTRLLKDSLGGNCRTVMIANVSPSVLTFEDTYNTLNYANRAKNIKTNVTRNILNVENHLNNYASIIQNLRLENETLKKQLQDKQAIGLPPINPGNQYEAVQNENVTKLERMIQKHFVMEQEILKSYAEIEGSIDKINNSIFASISDSNANGNKDGSGVREKIDSLKSNLKALSTQKEEYKMKHLSMIDKRNDILTEIKKANLQQANLSYIMSQYQQNQAKIENQDFMQKEQKSDTVSKHREQQVAFLQQQIKLRDGMINEWKDAIERGKIKHQIIYRNLRSVDEITEQAKLNYASPSAAGSSQHQTHNQQQQQHNQYQHHGGMVGNGSVGSSQQLSGLPTPKRRVVSQLNINMVKQSGSQGQLYQKKLLKHPLSGKPVKKSILSNEHGSHVDSHSTSSVKSSNKNLTKAMYIPPQVGGGGGGVASAGVAMNSPQPSTINLQNFNLLRGKRDYRAMPRYKEKNIPY